MSLSKRVVPTVANTPPLQDPDPACLIIRKTQTDRHKERRERRERRRGGGGGERGKFINGSKRQLRHSSRSCQPYLSVCFLLHFNGREDSVTFSRKIEIAFITLP